MSNKSLRSGAGNRCGPLIKRYVDHVVSRGYAADGVREGARIVEHYCSWLGERSLNRATVQQFMRRHLPNCRCQKPMIRNVRRNCQSLHRLLAIIHPPTETRRSKLPRGFTGKLLRRYEKSLLEVRGLVAGTVRNRLRSARTMLTRLGVRRANQLTAWTPERIEDYVASEARRHQPSTAHAVASATRSFLRFLLQGDLIQRDLSAAVPRFARWRLASLPATLREEELIQLLNMPDVNTAIGLRDRAILRCMSELGLRAAEVASLELNSVDLVSGLLQVRRGKRGGLVTLPMPSRLANALKLYLRRGRPTSTSQAIFVAHWPPDIGNPLRPVTISVLVKRWASRAGLRKDIGAAHVLRHSVASRMLGAGASLRQIAEILGHQSIDTTTIYAKVDLNALSQVGLPWPGAKEVQR